MAAGIDLNVQGMEQFQRKIEQLANPRKAKSMARKAARQAMNIARDAARTNAKAIDDPQTREKIHKNIAVAGGKSRNPSEIIMRVGVKGGASFSNPNPPSLSGGDTRHWRWVELGSSNNRAVPFMRPALSTNLDQITSKFVQVFDDEINKALGAL